MVYGKFLSIAAGALLAGLIQIQPAIADDDGEESVSNWSGIHLDLGLGAGAAVSETTIFTPADMIDPATTIVADGIGSEGIFGTIGFGYDFMRNQFVFGAFADFDLSGMKSTIKTNEPGEFNSEIKTDHIWSIGARGGVLVNDETLVYGLIGYSQIKFSVDDGFRRNLDPDDRVSFGTHRGVVLGAGIEVLLRENWSLRGEYRYGAYSKELVGVDGDGDTTHYEPSTHTARAVVGYRFNTH